MQTLVVATTNAGKVREIQGMLGDLPLTLLTLARWSTVEAPEETGETFEENARLKALYYAKVTGELPQLPFFDATFDLALCSHLLFQQGELHDVQFHLRALRELCRVAHEVRVFPLLEASGAGSRHLPEVLSTLEAEGYSVKIEPVDYEFQKGGNQMLRLIGA